MARLREMPQQTLDSVLERAREGKTAPVYVFTGESFQTEAAARSLIDVLVRPGERSWNLEVFDGRTADLGQVLETLCMPGFGSGTKLVWLKETPLFLSGETRRQTATSMFNDWRGNRQRAAAEKLMTLLALAGWSQTRWEEQGSTPFSVGDERELFGAELDDEERVLLGPIAEAARQLDLRIVEHRDRADVLLDCVERGLAPGVVLVLTMAAADRRRRAWQRLCALGSVVEFVLERQRSEALSERSVLQVVQAVLREHRMEMEPAAMQWLVERAGKDPQRLAVEVEKLCLWAVGTRRITREDVETVCTDLAEAWVFDFTAAFAQRNIERAAPLLRRLLDDGEAPVRLLALLAREVRLLLLAREAIDFELGGRTPPPDFAGFQKHVLPRLEARTREAFGKTHEYVLFRSFRDALHWSGAELRGALVHLARLDVESKCGRGEPKLLLERFVFEWTLRSRPLPSVASRPAGGRR